MSGMGGKERESDLRMRVEASEQVRWAKNREEKQKTSTSRE